MADMLLDYQGKPIPPEEMLRLVQEGDKAAIEHVSQLLREDTIQTIMSMHKYGLDKEQS